MNNLKCNYNLSKNSWFGLGGKADKFFTPDDENELSNYIKKIQMKNIFYWFRI